MRWGIAMASDLSKPRIGRFSSWVFKDIFGGGESVNEADLHEARHKVQLARKQLRKAKARYRQLRKDYDTQTHETYPLRTKRSEAL